MDAISSSTKLPYLFILIIGLPIMLLIFSLMVWTYDTFKRLSFVSYIADIIFTLLILWITVSNMLSYSPWRATVFNMYVRDLFFLFISMVLIIVSIFLYRKYKRLSNVLINISSLLSVIIWFTIIKSINM